VSSPRPAASAPQCPRPCRTPAAGLALARAVRVGGCFCCRALARHVTCEPVVTRTVW
jgi:hypothetical protein